MKREQNNEEIFENAKEPHPNELIMISSKIHIPKIWAMMAVPVFALINLLHMLNIAEIIKKELAERDRILSMKS